MRLYRTHIIRDIRCTKRRTAALEGVRSCGRPAGKEVGGGKSVARVAFSNSGSFGHVTAACDEGQMGEREDSLKGGKRARVTLRRCPGSTTLLRSAFGFIRRRCGAMEGTVPSRFDSFDKNESSALNFVVQKKEPAMLTDFLP